MLSFFRNQLSHHRHTGRLLPHEHTSYAALAFLALVGGLILMLATKSTIAVPPPQSDTITVNAAVKTAQTPVITVPADGQRFSAIPVTVAGTCSPDFVVTVLKNAVIAGSVLCRPDGRFSLEIDLFEGSNRLTARHDRPGPVSPDSDPVTVFYDRPAPPAPAPSSQSSATPSDVPPLASRTASQLTITADEGYKGAHVGQELQWTIRLAGGQPPYAVNWDWGDGSSDLVSLTALGSYTAKHTYNRGGVFKITIRATDAAGVGAYLQLVAVVRATSDGGGGVTGSIPPTTIAWPLYAMVLLVLVSFWLGDRFELWYIRRHLDRVGL
ncbi:PKD domain-containing protein [Candidatus Parcubacteria bacterium]|nr:PKD domain-containing protein [Candidatus Parcubacteria bacterium]